MASVLSILKQKGNQKALKSLGFNVEKDTETIANNIKNMGWDDEGGMKGAMEYTRNLMKLMKSGKTIDNSNTLLTAKGQNVFKGTQWGEELNSGGTKVTKTASAPRQPESTALREDGTIGYSKKELEEQAAKQKATQDEAYRNSELYKAESGEYSGNSTDAALEAEYGLKRIQRRVEQGEGREMTRTGRGGGASINEATGKEWTPEELAAKNGFSLENGRPVVKSSTPATPQDTTGNVVGGKSQGQTAVQEQSNTAAGKVVKAASMDPTARIARAKRQYGGPSGESYGLGEENARKRMIEQYGQNITDLQQKFKAGEMSKDDYVKQMRGYNKGLREGPNTMDYIIGNNVHGKAAGVAIGAGVMSAIMGDGRRSNAQLYSSPF